MIGLVMAGGKGMRLRPLTKDTPKPMLKVGNKPILQTIIEKFRESTIFNIGNINNCLQQSE